MALGALLQGFLLPLLLQLDAAPEAMAAAGTRGRCKATCGNIKIAYPFGIGHGCYAKEFGKFDIRCNETTDPPTAFLGTTDVEVIDISVAGQLRIKGQVGYDCYDSSGRQTENRSIRKRLGKFRPYTFSHTGNKFVVLGCDTYAFINGKGSVNYTGGCISYCSSPGSVRGMEGNCSGVGCCKTAIPRGLQKFTSNVNSYANHSYCLDFNPCGYAFLIEESQYTFHASDLRNFNMSYEPPVVLDWSIGNQTCDELVKRKADTACRSSNSECVDSGNGVGYNCWCRQGYEGNPYLPDTDPDRCRDIDECLNPHIYCNGTCKNTEGGYRCINKRDTLKFGLGIGLGFMFVMVLGTCVGWEFLRRRLVQERRKLVQVKQRMFEQNGGLFLQEEISSRPGNTFKLFTEEELARATDNFDEEKIIGRGGHGIVYKGTLEGGAEVAIKKSRMVDERQSKEFAREMAILSQINHVHVVKLLGCCLEVEIPMLVYEFIPCGTLFDFIHQRKHRGPNSLATRLRLAREAAEALAYLHSHASERPIIHRDVKTTNVLLDEQYRAKVSDFGASILAPTDKNELATVVQGTCGYLDPEYLQTYQLTEKSDVYSFGVVLAELLTGKKPLHLEGGLAVSFVSSVKEGRLKGILDAQIDEHEGQTERLLEVAELATRCLSVKGEDRPTMKDVAMVLHVLGKSQEHWWVSDNPEEAESLLSVESFPYPSDNSTTVISGGLAGSQDVIQIILD